MRAHRRVLDFERLGRPVAGRRDHQQRPRRDRRGNLDVGGVEPQARRVLAQAAALHVQRDHVDRRRHRDRGIDGAEQERLRAAARLAGHAESRRGARTGSVSRKSSARMLFHSCRPPRLRPHRFSRRPPKVCGSCWLSL